NGSVNGLGLSGDGKRRQTGGRILGRLDIDLPQPFRESLRDLARVARSPDTGTVDPTTTALQAVAVHHHVDVAFLVIHHVIAEEDLAETRSVDLHAGIPVVTLSRFGAPEDLHALAAIDDLGAHVGAARVDADRLARHARLEERCRH